MRFDVMVVGIKAIDDDNMELELQPLLQANKQGDVLTSIMSGNIREVLNEVGKHTRITHKIIMSRQWCMQKNIIPFCSMSIDVDIGDDHKARTGMK